MSPIPIILILLAVTLLFYVFLPVFTFSSKKRNQNLLRILSREGASHNLTFCSQEILQNTVIGVDGIHRKIIIIEKEMNAYFSSIISLDEVHDCQLVTGSGAISNGNFKKSGLKNHLSTLALQFDFNNHAQPASIIFSNGILNSKREFDFLKAKAEYWCVMFSKMLNRPIEVRA